MPTPTIKICVDASFSLEEGVATYAYFIKTPDKVYQRVGRLQGTITSSTQAERYGIANTLWVLDKVVDLSQYHVILHCDNVSAINRRTTSKQSGKVYREVLAYNEWFYQHIESFLLKAASYECVHVKGHLKQSKWSNGNFEAHQMNHWCDQHARRALRTVLAGGTLDGEARTV